MYYLELQPTEKIQLVDQLSRTQNTRRMFIDDWLSHHNPEVESNGEGPILKSEVISKLSEYLRIRKG